MYAREHTATVAQRRPVQGPGPALMQLIREKNRPAVGDDPQQRLEGRLAVHCRVDLDSRRVVESAAMATQFRGYEALLPGRDLLQVGLVSATASGVCGGVHATASALALEMALGLTPPPLGIVLRNLLLSCQYLNDNCLHLFVLAGPDYSRAVFARSNPDILASADAAPCRHRKVHGFTRIGDLMAALDRENGSLPLEALQMAATARRAYTVLGGKYPHSESIVPGGVNLSADAARLDQFSQLLRPFAAWCEKAAAVWNDLFDFLLAVQPRYADVGRAPATLFDFGQWDDPDAYDARYENCDVWGQRRWATPATTVDGRLTCTRLSELNAGLEEHLDFSYRQCAHPAGERMASDPLGHALSPLHPWNKRSSVVPSTAEQAYSWGSSLTWRGHGFEVGACARLYLTALAQCLPPSQHLHADGKCLEFHLPEEGRTGGIALRWEIPQRWNAFERHRARACTLAFTLAVTRQNVAIARRLLASGEIRTQQILTDIPPGTRLGVGLWGASRGFLAHWLVLRDRVIDNYQIAIPSRINAGTRSPDGAPGPVERALNNTPILEQIRSGGEDFCAIDIQRAIQSFDPCMQCTASVLVEPEGRLLERRIET